MSFLNGMKNNWPNSFQNRPRFQNFAQNNPDFMANHPRLAQFQGQMQGQGSPPQAPNGFGSGMASQWQPPMMQHPPQGYQAQFPNNQPPSYQPPQFQGMPRQGMNWTGGDPNFDERTGLPRQGWAGG